MAIQALAWQSCRFALTLHYVVDSKSSKFWEVRRDGASVRVRYGRIGADGTKKTKEYADRDAAIAEMNKLIAQKTKKGYEEPDPAG